MVVRTSIYLGSTETTTYEVPIFRKDKIDIVEKTFIPTLYKSFNEIADNAMDELTQLKQKDKKISIGHNIIDNTFKVSDNGRGVPIDLHPQTGRYTPETVFTELRSGRNFNDDAKESGVIGTNGVGSSCVAFISEKFDVSIKRDGKIFEQSYLNGTKNIGEPSINLYPGKDTGTTIEFKIDTSLKQFATTDLDEELIKNRAIEIALNNPEMVINYSCKKIDEEGETVQVSEAYSYKGGLLDYIKTVSDHYFEFKIEDPAFTAKYFVLTDAYQGIDEKLFVYVNSSLLFEGGTAATMFFNSFYSSVQEALKKETKSKKIDLNRNDVRQNLLIIADVKMKNPRYDNQSKTRLISQEIKKYIDIMIEKHISKFISQNPQWVADVLARAEFRQRIADMTELKKTQRKKRGKLAKLIDCFTKERGKASIAFSEGDCLHPRTLVKVEDGYKYLQDLAVGDLVITHTQELKPVIKKDETFKREWMVNHDGGTISCSKNHKHVVYDTELKKTILVTTEKLDTVRHKLLRKT